jgi:DGQHR domain-containing protein
MSAKKATNKQTASEKIGARNRYSVSLIQQGKKQFYSVTMPTDVLAKCCFVTSRNENPIDGFQRVLDRRRAQDIADYIDSGEGTIPGSIILSAQPEAKLKVVDGSKTLEFTPAQKAFLILDGQHRVYGFSLAQKAFRVPVVIYNGLSPVEEARLFIDINTKQRQVPNELLLDIKQLARRESDRDVLMRETFNLFDNDNASALHGLMSPSARQSSKISRVTFNLAFKSTLPIFASATPENVYQVTNSYIGAFADVLAKLDLSSKLTAPVVFRAIMEAFPEVARISAAQHGKAFTKAKFASVISPIADQLTVRSFDKASANVSTLAELFASLIKKDFSI